MKYLLISTLVVLALAGCSALVPLQAWEALNASVAWDNMGLVPLETPMDGDALQRRDARQGYDPTRTAAAP